MKEATLSDFIALNDQLLALVQAGIPVNLGFSQAGMSATQALERINASVARSVGQGRSLTEALEDNRGAMTPAYRSLIHVGLQSGDLGPAFRSAHDIAETVEDASRTLRLALLYPIVLCAMVYAGLVSFCLLLAPRMQHLLADLRLPAGPGFQIMSALRSTLPYWIAIPPLVLLLALIWIGARRSHDRRGATWSRLVSWLPGTAKALFEQRCASFAHSLASALDVGMPLDEALALTANVWNDPALEARLRASAPEDAAGTSPAPMTLPLELPAFLRWAINSSAETNERARNLRIAAGVYQEASARRLQRVRIVAPMVTCVVLGGGVTLLYGMVLFLPVVQLLRGLAS